MPSRAAADAAATHRSFARWPSRPIPSRPRIDEVMVSSTIVALSLVTIGILFLPGISFATIAPSVDLVLNTFALTIAGVVAGLAWVRFREAGQPHELFQSSAFLALAIGGLMALRLTVTGRGDEFGFSLDAPGQAPLYLWDLQRLTAGLLFLAAGWVGFRHAGGTVRHPYLVLIGPAALLAVLSGLVITYADDLPVIRTPEQIAVLGAGPQVIDITQVNPGVAAVEIGIALLFVLAATLFHRTYVRSGRRSLLFLVLGLIVAATAQVHSIFVPTSYSGVVTSVDVFRVVFYAILLLGVATGARGDLRTLRRAHDEVRALRDADVRAAELQERARLAREMHDGLIQDLWLARLKTGHLLGVETVTGEARALAEQLDRALEAASTEARQALASLTPAPDATLPLAGSIARLVDGMSERLEPELQTELSPTIPDVSAEVELEILRIIREAIMNAAKHADATLVRVVGTFDRGMLRLEVADNGVGFDPVRRAPGFGLRSMHDRAAAIGAHLTIRARPHDGARVTLELPIGQVTASRDGSGIARPSAA